MSAGALNTDFDLMSAVAAGIDGRNEEIRTMLGSFIGQMSAVPSSVWGGAAAARFREVVDRWNAESLTLHASLSRIAETMRDNERTLRAAARVHAEGLGAVAADVDAVPR